MLRFVSDGVKLFYSWLLSAEYVGDLLQPATQSVGRSVICNCSTCLAAIAAATRSLTPLGTAAVWHPP